MKTTHTKQKKESEKIKLEGQTKNSRNIYVGTFVAIIIAVTPYLYYSYESVPRTEIWDTFLFTYESIGYKNANDFAWLFLGKFVPWLLLIIWFLTCRNWWYHVILIPIAMYSFQLSTIINDDSEYVDEVEIYWLIPIMMIIVPIVYLIRIKLFDKLVLGIDLKKIDEELAEYERKENDTENNIELK